MDIIGTGFLARNHATIADRHPNVTMIAAGASSTVARSATEFQRERSMVVDVTQRCSREGRLVLLFSTASHAMYGDTDEPVTEDEPIVPQSPFGQHKLQIERLVADSGAPWLTVRLSHAVGADQPAHQLFPDLVRLVRSGEITLYENNYRDFIDVAQVVRAVDALLATGVSNELLNLASGVTLPVPQLVRGIEQTLGIRARKTTVAAKPRRTRVSVAKLHRLVPACGEVRYDEGYLRHLSDRYAACY